MSFIGRSVTRLEDRPLITGKGRYAADISAPGQLHMRVVRSPLAHGRVVGIDVAEALTTEGVVAVWTTDDVEAIPPIDFRQEGLEDLQPYRQPVLAGDVVRYVGEPVAVVSAEDAYVAEDAAEAVFIDLDPLSPQLSATQEPGEFERGLSTEASVIRFGYGDVETAFTSADHTISMEVSIGRHTGVPMETRGGLAMYDDLEGVLRVFGAAKVPHYNRAAIARMLKLPSHAVVLHEGHVGGGFGVRGELYPEDVLMAYAALKLRRPVKWIEDRKEHLVATNHSRDQVHRIEAAVGDDGYIHALRDEFWLDQGAYIRTHAATVPNLTAAMLPGPYVIPAYSVTGHIRLTNKTPAGTYRAPGRYEATFARERLLDKIAHRLGIDPLALRRRNLIAPEAMPFSRPIRALGTDIEYDSGDYPLIMDKIIERLDEFRAEAEEAKRAGQSAGVGVAFFLEKSGLGPFEGVKITVGESGGVRIVTGAASVGQGVETVIAQICAETLDVPLSSITVIHGQTDAISHGLGAFASRVTVMTGTATHMASQRIRDKALERASDLMEADVKDLELVEGGIRVIGAPERRISLGEVAASLSPTEALKAGVDVGLSDESWFSTDHMTYPYGIHIATVTVDEGTGEISILRYAVAYDIGRAVNPVLVHGQIVGGAAQGLGGALLEEFLYDEEGQPLATSFMDYLLPTATEMPHVDVMITEDAPSPLNPLGLKGAGEGGTTAFGAAIAAAIDDAIGVPSAVTRLPVTPERMKQLLKERSSNTTDPAPTRKESA